MNPSQAPSLSETEPRQGIAQIEALLRAAAQRDGPLPDQGFTARVLSILPMQQQPAMPSWRCALPQLIVAVGVLVVLLAGLLVPGLGSHAGALGLGAQATASPWPILVATLTVSASLLLSLEGTGFWNLLGLDGLPRCVRI